MPPGTVGGRCPVAHTTPMPIALVASPPTMIAMVDKDSARGVMGRRESRRAKAAAPAFERGLQDAQRFRPHPMELGQLVLGPSCGYLAGFRRGRCFADTDRMMSFPRPVAGSGIFARAIAAATIASISGRASTPADSTRMKRV